VRHRPVPVLDAVLGWVRREAGGFSAPAARARPALRARARDAILVAAAALPALAIALG